MMVFCTLFDSNYAGKGIAMYLSLMKQTEDFVLYVMGMDRKCQELLNTCGFGNMIVECIEDVASPELAEAKNNRSRAEFCWTCGSFVTDYFLNKYNLPDITYLDSDLLFFSSPIVLYDEFKKKNASVGLSPHFINNPIFGKYCVQYVYFKNNEEGRKCLRWWRDECLKWCYSKLEEGKYGDQKYLDYFHGQFKGVVDVENRGAGIANWNQEKYEYNFINNTLNYKGKEWPVVFFHYNGLNVKVKDGCLCLVHSKYFEKGVVEGFIKPYAEVLSEVYQKYLGSPISGYSYQPLSRWKDLLNAVWVKMRQYAFASKAETVFMNYRYAKRKSPYSERA